jgi:DNA-binding CsgD family transcriptional regulator
LISGESADDPGTIALLAGHQKTRFATWFRRERVEDGRWYAAPAVSEARRSGEVDDFIATSALVGPGVLQGFVIYRPWGAKPFAPRERRIARLFHAQVLRLIHVGRSSPGESPDGQRPLSPRVRQTLEMLLTGDSMKQIAAKLGISPHTVNDYTKALYRRFDVSTRAELINRYHAIAARQRRGLKLPTPGDA